jgi:hypothetical protein
MCKYAFKITIGVIYQSYTVLATNASECAQDSMNQKGAGGLKFHDFHLDKLWTGVKEGFKDNDTCNYTNLLT